MKNITKLPYEEARLEVTNFPVSDVVSTSGGNGNRDDGGWTH